MTILKTILLLDVDGKAVDNIVVPAHAVRAIALGTVGGYTGPLWQGAQWDGKKLIDPSPPAVAPQPEENEGVSSVETL